MAARTMRNTARRVTIHVIAMHLFQMLVTFRLIQLKKKKKKGMCLPTSLHDLKLSHETPLVMHLNKPD